MAAAVRPYLINVKYQHDEEILQCEVWYFNPVPEDLAVEDLAEISAEIVGDIATNLDELSPNGLIVHSVTVTTPSLVGGEGPARYINAYGQVMAGDGTSKYMDSICANMTLRGTHSQGKPAISVTKWSIVPREKQDRNQLDATWVAALETAFGNIFPQEINVGAGTLQRAVKSLQVDEIGDPLPLEWVYPTTLSVSSRVGSNLTRVGNRPQSNAGAEPEE
jgi:hypothetical protein